MRKGENVIIAGIPLGLHWNTTAYFLFPGIFKHADALNSDQGNALEPKYNCADCCWSQMRIASGAMIILRNPL